MQDSELKRRRRLLFVCLASIGLAVAAVVIAKILVLSISLVTNLAYFGRFSWEEASPAKAVLGWGSVLIPVVGGLIVGLMARYGSRAIRGHGIPEAMEKILNDESRVPMRMMFLKPLSAAVAIGSGGPFGAEGPIIATGGALGSVLGQVLPVSATERKILLASGAAAGMTAIFGTPFSAVLLAIELLLFEFRAKSFIPVALGAVVAGTLRFAFIGRTPVFPMAEITPPGMAALGAYLGTGVLMGFLSVGVTKAIYWIEDAFEKLPVHWMWWPALGGVVVGLVGLVEPRSLGIGYDNISDALSGFFPLQLAAGVCFWKFVSWSFALGSGTSGGTLAPILTVGACAGLMLGEAANRVFPGLGLDTHVMALVGMASLFAGASRAVLASAVFAFEATRQPLGLLPLLGGCSASYLVSALLMENSIMTEKIVRKGVRVPHEYYPRA